MFNSSKADSIYPSASSGGKATVIASGVKVEGDFSSEGDVIIEGQVNGNLSTTSMLTVGGEAVIKADVSAREAVVSGTIEGNVTVSSRLSLKSTAKVVGDVTAENVEIESGAQLHGKVAIGQKPVQSHVAEMKSTVPRGFRTIKDKSGVEESFKIPKLAD